jgi:hypothetical protein
MPVEGGRILMGCFGAAETPLPSSSALVLHGASPPTIKAERLIFVFFIAFDV